MDLKTLLRDNGTRSVTVWRKRGDIVETVSEVIETENMVQPRRKFVTVNGEPDNGAR